jgi:hypothetical protein
MAAKKYLFIEEIKQNELSDFGTAKVWCSYGDDVFAPHIVAGADLRETLPTNELVEIDFIEKTFESREVVKFQIGLADYDVILNTDSLTKAGLSVNQPNSVVSHLEYHEKGLSSIDVEQILFYSR